MTSTSNLAINAASQQSYKIVISWRRSCPSAGTVHRLYDRLADRYGSEVIFFDLETISDGNFPKLISAAISQASVLLVVVGRDWAGVDGAIDRIVSPKDWVFQEIRAAYELRKKSRKKRGKNSITLIPVSIDGARVPDNPELKNVPCLKHLIYNHASPLIGNRDLSGVTELFKRLDIYVPPRRQAEATPKRLTASDNRPITFLIRALLVGGCAVLILAVAVLFMQNIGQLLPIPKDEPHPVAKTADPSGSTKNVEPPPTVKSDNRTPATIRRTGTQIEVMTISGRVLAGGLGQETRLQDGVLISTHPMSGFAFVNVTPVDLADLEVVVRQNGQETVAEPFEYGSGYAYIPSEASVDKPAELRMYLKKE